MRVLLCRYIRPPTATATAVHGEAAAAAAAPPPHVVEMTACMSVHMSTCMPAHMYILMSIHMSIHRFQLNLRLAGFAPVDFPELPTNEPTNEPLQRSVALQPKSSHDLGDSQVACVVRDRHGLLCCSQGH